MPAVQVAISLQTLNTSFAHQKDAPADDAILNPWPYLAYAHLDTGSEQPFLTNTKCTIILLLGFC